MKKNIYIVAGSRPWNRRVFDEILSHDDGRWFFVSDDKELFDAATKHSPRYVFFFHWSNIIPAGFLHKHECVCFHMADVPYGRGGSPLQNLIARGHKETVLTALRMVEDLDAGPVYLKRSLSLEGLAEEIYIRATKLSALMASEIASTGPQPVEQEGSPVIFKRRKPAQSEITSEVRTLDELFDHIRMLDAEGYPRAFIKIGKFKVEFSRPAFRTGSIEADVRITSDNEGMNDD